MHVKWNHLLLIFISLFLIYYIWVELGSRKGVMYGIKKEGEIDNPVQGIKSN